MSCHETLQENGHRLTPQRMLVIEALHNSDKHISAEEIYRQLHNRYPYANISTVYRTLELLKKLDLVTETNFGEGRVRYHVADKGHHHHLVCHSCGKTIDLEEAALYPLKNTLCQKYGFDADLRHLAISGECSGCHKKRGQTSSTILSQNMAMDDVQEKLRILLDYWIEHNGEHEQEFRDWADRITTLSAEVAQQLREAAGKMAAASAELMQAKQALPESKERY